MSASSPKEVKRDTTITKDSAVNTLFFDSTGMEQIFTAKAFPDSLALKIRNFYNGRNYQYAWFFNDGLAEYATTFHQLYQEYISYANDSALYDAELELLYDSALNKTTKLHDSIRLKTEVLLTAQFFKYSRRAYQGSADLNTEELDWFIPRKKIDPAALLDSLLLHKGKNVAEYEPVNKQYNLLKQQLIKYSAIAKAGGLITIPATDEKLKYNDSSAIISVYKKYLAQTGDLLTGDTSNIFTVELENAIKQFQARMGYTPTGTIGKQTFEQMNISIQQRLQQILLNMERLRWLPVEPGSDYLWINIPEFKLHVFENGQPAFNMNVVTGTAVNSTVIFSGNLKYVVFNPYWNVPTSILQNEILPAIQRNKNYLNNQNMEWYAGGVRQKPGKNNALGQVKFLFPNVHNIYLHDTPSKHLFSRDKRAFSHGCIRLSEPMKLAEYLLRNDTAWTKDKIKVTVQKNAEQYVTLKKAIPVFIVYLTAWVDQNGNLCFRDDVYGHDKKLADRLFKQ